MAGTSQKNQSVARQNPTQDRALEKIGLMLESVVRTLGLDAAEPALLRYSRSDSVPSAFRPRFRGRRDRPSRITIISCAHAQRDEYDAP